MSAQPLDVRLSALEASVDRRFDAVDRRFDTIDRRFDTIDRRFDTIDRKIDGNLKTIIGWMLGQTAVIVGALAAVAFALRH
jgi:hypothetical protein